MKRQTDQKKTPEYGMLNNIRYTVHSVWEYQRFLFVLILVEALMGMLIPLLGTYLPKLVIDELAGKETVGHIIFTVGGFTLLMVATQFIGDYASTAKYMRYNNLRMDFTSRLYRKYLVTDYSFTESAVGQTMYQRAMNATTNGDGSGISRMIPAIVNMTTGILSFVLFSAILSTLHPLVALLLTITALLNYFVLRSARNYEQKTKNDRAAIDRKINYLTRQSEDLTAAKDIRLYRVKELFFTLREKLLHEYTVWENRVQNKHFVSAAFQALTTLLRDGFAYGYLFYTVIEGHIGIADAVLYFGAISRFSEWVTQIVSQFNEISQAQQLLCDMRAYLEHEDMAEPASDALLPDLSNPPEIAFDNVCFAYEKGGKNVLDHFSLRIASGEKVAVVGVNGAGKTTIVKLLCGFYKPDNGCITINGIDISRFRKSDLVALFSAVFQDPFVLPATIAENIALCEGRQIDRVRLNQCVVMAGLAELVSGLENGVDTELMKISDEKGILLSGGETQKLLLARALYKDAPALILDEPTAALDPIAESLMYDRYNDLAEKKTSVFISHRLASTRFCDKVVFLCDGRPEEVGTHSELLARNGKYAEMFEIQSSYYRKEAAV